MLTFAQLLEKKTKIKINPKKEEVIESSPEKDGMKMNHGEDCDCMKCDKKRSKASKSDDSDGGPDVSKNQAESYKMPLMSFSQYDYATQLDEEQLDEFLSGLMKMFGGGKSAPSTAQPSPGQQAQRNADALAPYVPMGGALLNRRQQMDAAMKELGYSKGGKVPSKTSSSSSSSSKPSGGTAPSTARREEYTKDFIAGVITELRRSEKEGKGSPERRLASGHLVGARAERKRKGEMGGRHHYSGSQEYGGSQSERGKKKNEPGSQHSRLNPPEEKGRQLKRGTKAATNRAYGYGQGRYMGD